MDLEFSKIKERDTNLLFLEEFYSSKGFVEWFFGQLKKKEAAIDVPNDYNLIKCVNSYHPPSENGETDIYLSFKKNNGEKLKILIENKIDAELQPEQDERYKERAKKLNEENNTTAYTVVFAPEKYFSSHSSLAFDYTFSYECILKALKDTLNNDSQRTEFKIRMLEEAIKKKENSSVKVIDQDVTEFCKCYRDFANADDNYKILSMKDPGQRSTRSTTINFHPWGNKKINMVHQMNGAEEGSYLYLLIPVLNVEVHEKIRSFFSECQKYTIIFEDRNSRGDLKDIPETKIKINTDNIEASESFENHKEGIENTLKEAWELYKLWNKYKDNFRSDGSKFF